MTIPAQLIERVERAMGPDRELDLRISMALRPEWWTQFRGQVLSDERLRGILASNENNGWEERYTASVDVAVALIEAKLPGRMWRLAVGQDRAYAEIYPNEDFGRADTPALALILALLRALSQEQPT